MKNGNDGVCHCKRGLGKEKRKGGGWRCVLLFIWARTVFECKEY